MLIFELAITCGKSQNMYFSLLFIQRLYRMGLLLVMILVIIDLLIFFYYPETALGNIFLATREQTPLTWISSLAFLFIALSCFSAYLESKNKLWFFLSATFFFFSLDDAVYLHERLSGFLIDNTTVFNCFPTYSWIILYFPLLVFSLSALVYFLWKDASDKSKKIVITALIFLGIAIFLDLTDGFVQKNSTLVFCIEPSCHSAVLHLLRLIEEVLEIFALGVLGYVNIQKHCLTDKTKN